MRTSGKTALLPKLNLHRTGPGGRKKHKKEEPKGFLSLSLSLSLSHACIHSFSLSFSLSPTCAYARSLSLSPHDGALFSLCLWIDVPSHPKDGFSCYYLNRAVTLNCNTDSFKSYNTVCPRSESCDPPRGF